MRALIISIVIMTVLAGCGQKGPLYLPNDKDKSEEQSKDVFL